MYWHAFFATNVEITGRLTARALKCSAIVAASTGFCRVDVKAFLLFIRYCYYLCCVMEFLYEKIPLGSNRTDAPRAMFGKIRKVSVDDPFATDRLFSLTECTVYVSSYPCQPKHVISSEAFRYLLPLSAALTVALARLQ